MDKLKVFGGPANGSVVNLPEDEVFWSIAVKDLGGMYTRHAYHRTWFFLQVNDTQRIYKEALAPVDMSFDEKDALADKVMSDSSISGKMVKKESMLEELNGQ